MDVKDAVLSILNGSSIDGTVDDLVQERVVCRYQGGRQRRVSKGRVYYVRPRVCTGRPDPKMSQRSRRAGRSGGAKQHRKIGQKNRWRGALKRVKTILPGQRKRGLRKRTRKRRRR